MKRLFKVLILFSFLLLTIAGHPRETKAADVLIKTLTASPGTETEEQGLWRYKLDTTKYSSIKVVWSVWASNEGSTAYFRTSKGPSGYENDSAYRLTWIDQSHPGSQSGTETFSASQFNTYGLSVWVNAYGSSGNAGATAKIYAVEVPHSHSYTLTTDNSKIRTNATTKDAATYWNKCSDPSCGAFPSSGSDYYTVVKPLVSYTSGALAII